MIVHIGTCHVSELDSFSPLLSLWESSEHFVFDHLFYTDEDGHSCYIRTCIVRRTLKLRYTHYLCPHPHVVLI